MMNILYQAQTSQDPTNSFTYYKVMDTNNLKTLIPWSYWIQNDFQPKHPT